MVGFDKTVAPLVDSLEAGQVSLDCALSYPHSEAVAPAKVEDTRVETGMLASFGSVVLESAEAELGRARKDRVNMESHMVMLVPQNKANKALVPATPCELAPLAVVVVVAAEVLG